MRSLSETLPKQYSTRGLVLRRAPAERLTTTTWQPASASMLVSRLPMKPAPSRTTIRSPGNDSALLVSQERKGAISDHLAGLAMVSPAAGRSEEHTSELQSLRH